MSSMHHSTMSSLTGHGENFILSRDFFFYGSETRAGIRLRQETGGISLISA